jgi:hypothetical protein
METSFSIGIMTGAAIGATINICIGCEDAMPVWGNAAGTKQTSGQVAPHGRAVDAFFSMVGKGAGGKATSRSK